MKIVSQKQARFLGMIAGGGKSRKGKGPSPAKARLILRENKGFHLRDLPTRIKSRQPSGRRPSR